MKRDNRMFGRPNDVEDYYSDQNKALILIGSNSPTPEKPHASQFVHERIKEYQKRNIKCSVFSIGKPIVYDDVEYKNILVKFEDTQTPNVLFVHFINKRIYQLLCENKSSIPTIVWVHGFGMISWKRYLFEFELTSDYLMSIYVKMRNMMWYKTLCKKYGLKWVFVSRWMFEMTKHDSGIVPNNYRIIPNPISDKIFKYRKKTNRFNILVIRSFEGMKYCPDIISEIADYLSKDDKYKITIVGDGKYWNEYTDKLSSKVLLRKGFVSKQEIVRYHKENTFFLCPTRMDAQGVSMCEAMMSGLIPISNPYPSVEEFTDGNYIKYDGLKDLKQKIEECDVEELSLKCHNTILNKCNVDKIINEELQFMGAR